MKISGVVLAAGRSSRLGQNKLLLPFKNHTVLEEVLYQLSRSQVEDILVITGFERTRIEELLVRIGNRKIKTLFNNNFESGRAESIKCAINYLRTDTDAALFMVADKPTVRTDLIDRAIEEFKSRKASILYIKTPKGRGHPIIFSKGLFKEMMSLTGDNAMEEFISKRQKVVVELEDEAIQPNINTWEDYKALCG